MVSVYSYYDYLEKYYEDYYDNYYEQYYWPYYYGVITVSNETYICGNTSVTNATLPNNTMSMDGTIINNGTLCHIFNATFPPSPYEYKSVYNLDYITPPLFSLSVACAVLASFIAIIFFRKVFHSKKLRQKKLVTIITSFAIICHLGYALVDPMMYYFWWIGYNLTIVVRTEIAWEIWWLSTKLSLYAVYIYRYYMIFVGAKFVSSQKKVVIFGGFAVVMIVQMIIFALYIISYVNFLYDWEDMNARRTYLNMAWAFLVIDCVFIFAICFLLNRAILQIVIGTQKSTQPTLESYMEEPQSKSVSSPSNTKSETKIERSKNKRKVSLKRNDLMHATSKIVLMCLVSMVSSLFVQVLWLVQEETDHGLLYWISYVWPLDNVINMLCIHLLLGSARNHYRLVCRKVCKLHQCCLFVMIKIVDFQTKQKHTRLLMAYQSSMLSYEQSSTVHSPRSQSEKSNTDMFGVKGTEMQPQTTNSTVDGKVTKMATQTSNESVNSNHSNVSALEQST